MATINIGMLKHAYTLVTIVFRDEVGFLRLQARSLAMYLHRKMFREIIVIANEPPAMPDDWHERVMRAYADFGCRVRILTVSDLTDVPLRSGWFSQQVLKLLVAKLVKTEFYLLLDAKNHLTHPFKPDHLEGDGKPRMFTHSYRAHTLRRYLYPTLEYFGLSKDHADRFNATITPFAIHSQTCRDLLRFVEQKEQQRFEDVFMKHRPQMTEFFMYGSYLRTQREIGDLYNLDGYNYPVVWKEWTADHTVHGHISRAEREHLSFFSVHRASVPLLTLAGRQAVAEFWTRRGLFPNAQEAKRFLRNPND